MGLVLVIFGICAGCLINVLIGLLGSRRRIGFGWSFLVSLIGTPILGLIITLLFEPLPDRERKWGCLGIFISVIFLILMAVIAFMLLGYFGSL